MILIFGGTTEGRIAVKKLEQAEKPYFYSTKGDEQEITLVHGTRLQGGLDSGQLRSFCIDHNIRLIIDAAHPFAELLHKGISEVSSLLGIPVIRFERIFPEYFDNSVIWCDGYNDCIDKILSKKYERILALTGVKTISKLKPIWQGNDNCYFRILDRDSSRKMAQDQGFPLERICYYETDGTDRELMLRYRPEAVISKESGISGGFEEKRLAAKELGIDFYAVSRPKLDDSFIVVNGEHGLRRMVEKLLPEFYEQHTGITTGSCATSATIGALTKLFAPDDAVREVPIILPNGETIHVNVHDACLMDPFYMKSGDRYEAASSIIIKESGDDPDITNHIPIESKVELNLKGAKRIPSEEFALLPTIYGGQEDIDYPFDIVIEGGDGVGRVTMKGLGLPVGGPAINKSPQRMIRYNVSHFLFSHGIYGLQYPVRVTISVHGGKEVGAKTFNPRLGVVGGISIVGTSGIIQPFSLEGFINSIAKSMQVAMATGSPYVIINSGAKSEGYVKAMFPHLPAQAFVHYGNFIGETIKLAERERVPHLVMGVMMGKAVKLAEGHLDTHSKKVVMNKDFIASLARKASIAEEKVGKIAGISLARELWGLFDAEEQQAFCTQIIASCHKYCDPLIPGGKLTIVIISEDGKIFGPAKDFKL